MFNDKVQPGGTGWFVLSGFVYLRTSSFRWTIFVMKPELPFIVLIRTLFAVFSSQTASADSNIALMLDGPDDISRPDKNTNKHKSKNPPSALFEKSRTLPASEYQQITTYAFSERPEVTRPIRIPPFLVVDQVNG